MEESQFIENCFIYKMKTKIFFWITLIIDFILNAYLSHLIFSPNYPAWNWYAPVLIGIVFISLALGPGITASCFIRIIIGILI